MCESLVRLPLDVKDWKVSEVIDRGPGHYYRFQVRGENLNHHDGCPDRRFTWDVPTMDENRYDTSEAKVKR